MDHIPDEDGQRLNIQVPFLNHHLPYDGLEWESFPERAGYSWMTSPHLNVQRIEKHVSLDKECEIQGLLQEWLYFGILHTALGEQFSRDRLAPIQNHSKMAITTRNIDAIKQKLGFKTTIMRETEPYYGKSISNPIILTALRHTLVWDSFAQGRHELWGILTLSIYLLAEALLGPERCATINLQGASIQPIRRQLLQNTRVWCIHQVDSLCEKVSYTTLVYLTGLKRYERPAVDHAHCHRHRACVAFSITEGQEFTPSHTAVDCTCPMAEAPRSQQTQILERGGIPVLRCRERRSGSLELSYVPASPRLDYTAVSHVWADGLGNPFGHGLPRCQLLQLIGDIRTSRATSFANWSVHRKQTVYIWLDVYCIPPQHASLSLRGRTGEEEQGWNAYLKKKAIARMRTTYAWASRTLVLDQEIKHSPASDGLRAKAVVALSAWNGRCWTFQEYSLSKKCLFGFLDSKWRQGFENTSDILSKDFQRLLAPLQIARVADTGLVKAAIQGGEVGCGAGFTDAWNSFFGRTTTQWNDMAEVLANLLDLSAGPLLCLDGPSRMKAILTSQRVLPVSLLFAPLQRLEDESTPFQEHWVPKSVQGVQLSLSETVYFSPLRDMLVTRNGLRLRRPDSCSPVKLIRLPTTRQSNRIWFRMNCWLHSACECRYLCWAKIDAKRVCQGRTLTAETDVILLLDTSAPLCGRNLSATFRGACVLPTTTTLSRHQQAVYCGPIEWGTTIKRHVLNKDILPCLKSAGSDLYILSDIASWPKLPQSRVRKGTAISASAKKYLLIFLCDVFAQLILPLVIIIGDGPLSLGWDQHKNPVLWTFLSLPPLVIYLVGATHVCAMSYPFVYNTMPEVGAHMSWRSQMGAVFDVMPLKVIPWYDVLPLVIIWVGLWFMDIRDRLVQRKRRSNETVEVTEIQEV